MRVTRRESWDEYFLRLCDLISQRSTCLRRPAGAIIVKNKRILSTGYNGAPSGDPHCTELGCLRADAKSGQELENCRALGLHAETNAIINAARIGVSVEGATMYTKYSPCKLCCAAIVNAGISRVVYKKLYEGYREGPSWLRKRGIEVDNMDRH